MGQGRRGSKIGGGSKKIGTRKISPLDKGVWKEAVREDTYKKIVGPCNRRKGGVHAEKRESVPFVKRRKRGGEGICEGAIEEGIHPAVQVTTNGAGVLCRKEGWEKEDGARLSLSE